jgi:hypothetical protein
MSTQQQLVADIREAFERHGLTMPEPMLLTQRTIIRGQLPVVVLCDAEQMTGKVFDEPSGA